MQIFYSTMIATVGLLVFAIARGIVFTGDNFTNILIFVLVFAGAMAGANVGEHFAKAKLNGTVK